MSVEMIQGEARTVKATVTEEACEGCGQPFLGIENAINFRMTFPGGITLRSVKLAFDGAAALATVPSQITVIGHGLAPNEKIRLTTASALPTGLAIATDYYVNVITKNIISLSLVPGASAVALTAPGVGIATLEFVTIAWSGNPILGAVRLTFTQAMLLAMPPFEKLTRDLLFDLNGTPRICRYLNQFTLLAQENDASCVC